MSNYLDWKVGDKVQLVDRGALRPEVYRCGEVLPTKGTVYTIRNMSFDKTWDLATLQLVEIVNEVSQYGHKSYEVGFFAKAFRKIDRQTNIDIFKKMLDNLIETNNKELVERELKELIDV